MDSPTFSYDRERIEADPIGTAAPNTGGGAGGGGTFFFFFFKDSRPPKENGGGPPSEGGDFLPNATDAGKGFCSNIPSFGNGGGDGAIESIAGSASETPLVLPRCDGRCNLC